MKLLVDWLTCGGESVVWYGVGVVSGQRLRMLDGFARGEALFEAAYKSRCGALRVTEKRTEKFA